MTTTAFLTECILEEVGFDGDLVSSNFIVINGGLSSVDMAT